MQHKIILAEIHRGIGSKMCGDAYWSICYIRLYATIAHRQQLCWTGYTT